MRAPNVSIQDYQREKTTKGRQRGKGEGGHSGIRFVGGYGYGGRKRARRRRGACMQGASDDARSMPTVEASFISEVWIGERCRKKKRVGLLQRDAGHGTEKASPLRSQDTKEE